MVSPIFLNSVTGKGRTCPFLWFRFEPFSRLDFGSAMFSRCKNCETLLYPSPAWMTASCGCDDNGLGRRWHVLSTILTTNLNNFMLQILLKTFCICHCVYLSPRICKYWRRTVKLGLSSMTRGSLARSSSAANKTSASGDVGALRLAVIKVGWM